MRLSYHALREPAIRREGDANRYHGAAHGFFYYDMPTYRQQAAMDGWDKVDDFFKQYLA